jgi:hypothetical protein
MRSVLTAVAFVALAVPASADEVWSTARGHQIVYERDAGETAILSYKAEAGLSPGLIFVPGLGGKYEGRETYRGYWVEAADAGATCAAAIVDAEGKSWKRWGVAEVKFARAAFPSAITIRRSDCFGDLGRGVRAQPVVGAGVQ